MARVLLLFFSLLFPVWAGADSSWVPVDTPLSQETSLISQLAGRSIPVLAWSTAVVEVSDFGGGLETRSLATLTSALTESDPRWDPWLKALEASFHPAAGMARVWVPEETFAEAHLLNGGNPSPGVLVPRFITGCVLVSFGLLYWIFRLTSILLGPPPTSLLQRWRGLVLGLVLLVLGAVMVVGTSTPGGVPQKGTGAGVSWAQHRWFQTNWPYGALWNDWVPGKPWSYQNFQRSGDQIKEIKTTLETPDSAWAKAAWDSLDPYHAARIFGFENP